MSKAFYVQRCLKIARPFAKLKYILIIDSEQVLWRKGEKEHKIMKREKNWNCMLISD